MAFDVGEQVVYNGELVIIENVYPKTVDFLYGKKGVKKSDIKKVR